MASATLGLEGRRLAVVGGAHGIGGACVELAAASGARVAVVDADLPGASALVARLGMEPDRLVAVPGDACDQAAMEEAASAVVEAFGAVDAVINLVGGATPKPFLEMTVAEWRRELEFNLESAFLVARSFVPHLVAGQLSALVNSSSGYGARPREHHTGYAAAKAGVIGFTKTLALEIAPLGVRVNAVAPGATDTPRVRELLGEEGMAEAAAAIPLGRVGLPEDCAMAALFLASPASQHITGQVLHVNGGLFMP